MKRPFITLKFAQTLDGKIAASDGSSKWISSPQSLRFTHRLRAQSEAILVGINTVLIDDPSLTRRLVRGKNPVRVVIDPKLKIPLSSKVLKTSKTMKTIIITTKRATKKKMYEITKKNTEIFILPSKDKGNIDIRDIIRILYKKGVKSLLVEGGSRVISSFLKLKLVDKIVAIIAPKILGSGTDSVRDIGIKNIKLALNLKFESAKKSGKDIIYIATIRK